MKIDELQRCVDEMIEQGPTSDRETFESLLRFRDKLEETSQCLSEIDSFVG
jgi:hypothetical protein